MNKFYRYMITFYIFAGIFLLVLLVPSLVVNLQDRNWTNIIVIIVFLCLAMPIASFIFIYYRNVVIALNFTEDYVEIKSNKQTYPIAYPDVARIEKQPGRILIYCEQDSKLKRYIYQTIYSPFNEKMPNINEWREHLPNTRFINFY